MKNTPHAGAHPVCGPQMPALFAALVLALAFSAPVHAQVPTGPQSPGANNIRLGGLGDWGNSTPKAPAQRVLQGVVKNEKGEPVKGALVYLKSDREKGTRSMLTDEKGTFRFVQLSRTAEYKLWAQEKNHKSPEKAVSSFETKDEITRDLKLD